MMSIFHHTDQIYVIFWSFRDQYDIILTFYVPWVACSTHCICQGADKYSFIVAEKHIVIRINFAEVIKISNRNHFQASRVILYIYMRALVHVLRVFPLCLRLMILARS